MAEKHNSLITITYVTFSIFCNIPFEVCNNYCIMPIYGKNNIHQYLLSVFKMNDTVNFDDTFLYILVVIKP